MKKKIIAVDFDGTLCENKWPDIGEPNLELINYLKGEREKGNILILWTCRTEEELEDAIQWCSLNGLIFEYVNENTSEILEAFGTESRKIFANVYIDDRASNDFNLPFRKDKE